MTGAEIDFWVLIAWAGLGAAWITALIIAGPLIVTWLRKRRRDRDDPWRRY